jgi:hypothetical protein
MPETEANRLETHFAQCGPCLETLPTVEVRDELLQAVRQATPTAPADLPAGFLDGLTRRSIRTVSETPSAEEAKPAAVPHAPAGSRLEKIGPYRILEQFSGGMGTVYKAHDETLDRTVAVKVPRFEGSPEQRAEQGQRFLREVRSAARIYHPHVCPVYHYDFDEIEGTPYVVMPYMESGSLADRFPAGRPCDPREAVTLVRQAALALEEVHQRRLVHRDLKPHNILLDGKGQAVLADFGLAAAADGVDRVTHSGAVVGTPAYMAPEQAAGKREAVDHRTDLYSLGVVLYRLLTGRAPFEGDILAVLYRVNTEAPPPPSSFRKDLDPALEAVVLKAMARPREDRYASAREFREALEAWLGSPPPAAPAPAPAAAAAPRKPRRLAFVIGAAAAGLVAAAAALMYFEDGEGRRLIHVSSETALAIAGLVALLGAGVLVALKRGKPALVGQGASESASPASQPGATPAPEYATARAVAESDLSIEKKIEKLEEVWARAPEAFCWDLHNELRHYYGAKDERLSMEQCDIIFRHSLMDDYILSILGGWKEADDPQVAVVVLRDRAERYANLKYLAAACTLKAGDLQARQGQVEAARESYQAVAQTGARMLRAYRDLARARLDRLARSS